MGRDKEPLYGVRRTDGLGVIVRIRTRLDASKVLHCYDAKTRQKRWKGEIVGQDAWHAVVV
jgi:hypothetical protein